MDLLQSISAAGVVLLLLGLVVWFLQRKGLAHFVVPGVGSATPRRLQVIERVTLTPQHGLCLVRVEGRTILVATGPQSCVVIESEVRS